MATIQLYRMAALALDRGRVQSLAESLRISGQQLESPDAHGLQDDQHVLVQAGACGRLAGTILYVNHRAALGSIHTKPLSPERAGRWLDAFLARGHLNPGPPTDNPDALELSPWSRVSEAVVFDGRERRRVPARTDAGVRMRLNGLPVSGPRTRIRAVFGDEEIPLLLHVAVWATLEPYGEAELAREHDVIAALDRSLRGRTDCGQAFHVEDIRLVYSATEEFRGSPDVLAPYYLIEVRLPQPKRSPDSGPTPRQLIRVPAWRWPAPGSRGPSPAANEPVRASGGRAGRGQRPKRSRGR